MDRFRGASDHTIDEKGRIIIPVRFRQVLDKLQGDGVVVSRMDKTLFVYSYGRWSEIEEKIDSQAEKSETMRRFRRFFIGNAAECPWDKLWRVLIPPELRNYAALEKDITLVGVTDHFEIWNQEKWKSENSRMEEVDMKQEEVRNEIAKLGL
jgi:MraZ protein